MKIAFVDDDESLRRMYSRCAPKGVQAQVFDCAESAIAAFESGYAPDVIVSDNDMGPGMTGIDFGVWVRANSSAQFLLCTGGGPGVIEDARVNGLSLIRKPASMETILLMISN